MCFPIVYCCSLTGQDAATAFVVGDGTLGVDAVLSCRQGAVTDAVLAVTQLAELAGGTARGAEAEAAGITAANEGVGAGSEGCECDEVLHRSCSSANVEGVVK